MRGVSIRTAWEPLVPYIEAAISWAEQYGLVITVTSVRRDPAKQAALRANFDECVRRGLYPSAVSLSPGMSCKYPANRPGDSSHEWGLSFDSTISDPKARFTQAELDQFWRAVREAFGFRVPDNDKVHAEVPGWREFRPYLPQS